MRQSNVAFLVWGRARLRDLPEGGTHLIDLRVLVCHAAITADQARRFRRDFSEAMRGCLGFGTNGELLLNAEEKMSQRVARGEGTLASVLLSRTRVRIESPLADQTVPTQCEEFIQAVIDQEPERFVTEADGIRFERHVGIARAWMAEIGARLACE